MRTGLRPPSAGRFRPHQTARGTSPPAATGGALPRGADTIRATVHPSVASRLLCALLLFSASVPGLAHKVVTSAWTEGDAIVGEVGFSNGVMAEAGTKVEVFGPDGAKQGEVFTDADGLFRFVPREVVEHRFEVNLGAGHVAEVLLTQEELPVTLLRRAEAASAGDAGAEATEAAPAPASTAGGEGQSERLSGSLSRLELESLIARAVQRELRPLRKELSAYKEKNDLQGILGGIGYICGVFGLLFFIVARRRIRHLSQP